MRFPGGALAVLAGGHASKENESRNTNNNKRSHHRSLAKGGRSTIHGRHPIGNQHQKSSHRRLTAVAVANIQSLRDTIECDDPVADYYEEELNLVSEERRLRGSSVDATTTATTKSSTTTAAADDNNDLGILNNSSVSVSPTCGIGRQCKKESTSTLGGLCVDVEGWNRHHSRSRRYLQQDVLNEIGTTTTTTTTTDSSNNNPPTEDTSLLAKQKQQQQQQQHIQDEEEDLNYQVSHYTGSCVSDSLDLALMEAEDALIAKQNPSLLLEDQNGILLQKRLSFNLTGQQSGSGGDTLYTTSNEEEKEEFMHTMKEICPGSICDDDVHLLFLSFTREIYKEEEPIWKQNDPSDSVKLLIFGQLIAELENEAGTKEIVPKGSMIGELGLVNGNPRMSTVKCVSEQAILYSMSRDSFEQLVDQQPHLARYIDLICVKYLTLRVQHVSNRIFETRCLPI